MANALKEVYNVAFLEDLGQRLHSAYRAFQTDRFLDEVMDDGWEGLELKQRMRRISTALGKVLPERYEEALNVLLTVSGECKGFPYLIFPDFVEVFGQGDEHWELSMKALEGFTQGSSAEFAVRPFLLQDPERTMRQMQVWSQHANEHVRRLASEGCRPRLPWGQALPMFKQDPSPILPVLEQLKEDPSLYVRKSVANNLNDIAKDHPAVVMELSRRWKGNHPDTDWIVRHGCRSLIRKADPDAMTLFGYSSTSEIALLVSSASLITDKPESPIGGSSELSYDIQIREGDPAKVRIEYAVDFVKAKGQTSRKPFLLSDKMVPGGTRLRGKRQHRWVNLTTRRHYPGSHRITLLVNGRETAHTTITLYELKESGEES